MGVASSCSSAPSFAYESCAFVIEKKDTFHGFLVVYWLPRLFYAEMFVFLKTSIMDGRFSEGQSL